MAEGTCKICQKPARTQRSVYCSAECFRQSERNYSSKQRKLYSSARRRAYELVYVAVNTGELTRQPCEVCGKTYVEAHHDDYTNPLGVRWLCRSHHKQHHIKFGPGLNAYA
jgi:hypothetical protein